MINNNSNNIKNYKIHGSLMNKIRSDGDNTEGFDPTLRVNYRTDTERDDASSMRDVIKLKNIQNASVSYIDYANAWTPPEWTPSDQEIQNDYNRASNHGAVNCHGTRFAGASQYHPVPQRSYPLAPAEQKAWPALMGNSNNPYGISLGGQNALVEGAYNYNYNCEVGDNTIEGQLVGIHYDVPDDNTYNAPYQKSASVNGYGYKINPNSQLSWHNNNYFPKGGKNMNPPNPSEFSGNEYSQPVLKAGDALPSSEHYMGEYGLQYVNDYQTPSFDDWSNANNVHYELEGANCIPMLPVDKRILGFTADFPTPIGGSTSIPTPQVGTPIPISTMPTPIMPTPTPIMSKTSAPSLIPIDELPDASTVWTAGTTVNTPGNVYELKSSLDFVPFSNLPETVFRPKMAVYDPITKQITFDPPTTNNNSGETTFNGNSKINTYAFDPSIPDDAYNCQSGKLATDVNQRRIAYWNERKKIPQIPGWPNITSNEVPIYTTNQIDNIIDSIKLNEKMSKNASSKNAPLKSAKPSSSNLPKPSTNLPKPPTPPPPPVLLTPPPPTPPPNYNVTIQLGKHHSFDHLPNHSPSPFINQPTIKQKTTDSFRGETESFMLGRANTLNSKASFVPSTPNNYRNTDGSISSQYSNPNMLMRDGTSPIGPGPGPIQTEWNAAAASMALLNDVQNCPTTAGRGPIVETTMPDYNLQDPRNTTWGRDNKYYGITARYARDDPYRYRYLRHADIIQNKEPVTLTADAMNANMARRRCRDQEVIDRWITNKAHGAGYLVEELDTYEAWSDPSPLGGISDYPM
jgi:hypothetical protein